MEHETSSTIPTPIVQKGITSNSLPLVISMHLYEVVEKVAFHVGAASAMLTAGNLFLTARCCRFRPRRR
jgi:energy-converting hydrogenase Eha subunit A